MSISNQSPTFDPVERSDSLHFQSSNENKENGGFANIISVDTYKGKQLLHEMNLRFPEGSISVILGPSGAGKSTLLNLLTDSLPSNVKGSAISK